MKNKLGVKGRMDARMKSLCTKIIIICPPIILYSLLFFDKNRVVSLTKEDGFVENLGALFFLVCSVVFIKIYIDSSINNNTDNIKNNKKIIYLTLGLIFLLGFFEEISWGQRIFKFNTPAFIMKFNQQKEFNIHNLKWFHGLDTSGKPKGFLGNFFSINRLFSLFWLSFCLIIPILYRINFKFADLTKRFFIPIVPVFIGALFLLNYIASRCLEFYLVDFGHQISEIKETNFAYLFMIISLFEIKGKSKGK